MNPGKFTCAFCTPLEEENKRLREAVGALADADTWDTIENRADYLSDAVDRFSEIITKAREAQSK